MHDKASNLKSIDEARSHQKKTGQWNPFHQLKMLSCNIAGRLLTNLVFGNIKFPNPAVELTEWSPVELLFRLPLKPAQSVAVKV